MPPRARSDAPAADLRERVAHVVSQLHGVRDGIARHDADVKDLRARLDSLGRRLGGGSQPATPTDLIERLEVLEARGHLIEAKLDGGGAPADPSGLVERLNELEARLEARADGSPDPSGLVQRLNELEAKLEAKDDVGSRATSALAQRLDDLEASLEATRPTVPNDPGALERRVQALEEVASRVRAGDSALRGILRDQQDVMRSRASTLSHYEGRIGALEQAVEELLSTQRDLLARNGRAMELLGRLEQNLATKLGAVAAAPVAGDDLKRLKGVGPKFERALHAAGITRLAQIAAWTEQDIAAIAPQIGTTAGRIARDRWVEMARSLADSEPPPA